MAVAVTVNESTSTIAVTVSAENLADNALSELNNVATTSPSDGQVLKYSTSTSKWGPAAETVTGTNTGSGGAVNMDLTDLADVSSSGLGDGKVLTYDSSSTSWLGQTPTVGDITAVVAGTGLTGGATSGSATLNVSGLTVSEIAGASLQTGSESFVDNDTTLMTSAAIQDKILA